MTATEGDDYLSHRIPADRTTYLISKDFWIRPDGEFAKIDWDASSASIPAGALVPSRGW
jgi:hypothetical protein